MAEGHGRVAPQKHWVVKAYDGAVATALAADKGLMKAMDTLDNVASSMQPRDDTGGMKEEIHDLLVPAGIDRLPPIPRSFKRHVPKPGRGCCDFLLHEEDEDYQVHPYKYISVPMTSDEQMRAQGVFEARQGRSVWEAHEAPEQPSIFPVPPAYGQPPPGPYGYNVPGGIPPWAFWEPPPEIEDDLQYQKQAYKYQGVVADDYADRAPHRPDHTVYGEIAHAFA